MIKVRVQAIDGRWTDWYAIGQHDPSPIGLCALHDQLFAHLATSRVRAFVSCVEMSGHPT